MAGDTAPTITIGTGTEMPVIGLGTWELVGEEAVVGVRHALELGYRMIDTSDDYGNEPEVGEGVRSSGLPAEEVFVVSKIGKVGDAHAATGERVEKLGTGRLDLCLIHHPPEPEHSEALWRGLIEARDAGLVREIGVSNYSPEQVDHLIEATGEVPAVNQIEWSPFGHHDAVVEHARGRGVAIQAYSPLTRGRRLDDDGLAEVASAHDATPAQVMLAWCLQLGLAPLPKAASASHREENLRALDLRLGEDEMRRLGELNEHYSPVGGLPYV